MSLRLRALRLISIGREYGINLTANSTVRPLSVVAGEISTGKTSVLEFIDYCLGASGHPRHIEIQRHVRAALLEVEIDEETAVIERPTFTSDQFANVHRCALSELAEPHLIERRPLAPPGDSSSLSSFLLAATGLQGMRLKEAPTQVQSGADQLSFRDVAPLCFLTNQRMDNKNLLLESQHMRNLKLVQVIEILFGVYDNQLAAMGEQLDTLEEERKDLAAEIASLETFLAENDVPERPELEARAVKLEQTLLHTQERLDTLSTQMEAETTYAAEARTEYAKLRRRSGDAATRVRDRETLLRRLLPLRGQYAEDERKLVFFQEAERLFDPLRVHVCPACMQELADPIDIEAGGTCTLCRQHIASDSDPIDIAAERSAVRAAFGPSTSTSKKSRRNWALRGSNRARHRDRDCCAETTRQPGRDKSVSIYGAARRTRS